MSMGFRQQFDPNFYKTVLLTDEAHFTRTSILNVLNQHVWADENPQVINPNPL